MPRQGLTCMSGMRDQRARKHHMRAVSELDGPSAAPSRRDLGHPRRGHAWALHVWAAAAPHSVLPHARPRQTAVVLSPQARALRRLSALHWAAVAARHVGSPPSRAGHGPVRVARRVAWDGCGRGCADARAAPELRGEAACARQRAALAGRGCSHSRLSPIPTEQDVRSGLRGAGTARDLNAVFRMLTQVLSKAEHS
eukprot:1501210-Rhodomonas_salina.3